MGGLSHGPPKFFWTGRARPSTTLQGHHRGVNVFGSTSRSTASPKYERWRAQGTKNAAQPEEQPLFDPTGPQVHGDLIRGIRGGGHGLSSPLGHGVGGRSRRSRRGTTLPLHARCILLAGSRQPRWWTEPQSILFRRLLRQAGPFWSSRGGSIQRCMDLSAAARGGPRRLRG